MKLRALGIAAVLLAAGGCTCERDRPVAVTEATGDAPAALTSGGGDVLVLTEGRVRLDVDGAMQLVVLERLAQQGGFRLDVHGVAPRAVTLRLDGAPLREAIGALLGDVAFALEFAFEPESGAHELAVLRVGSPPPPPQVAAAAARPIEPPPRPSERAAPRRSRLAEEAFARARRRSDRTWVPSYDESEGGQQELFVALADPDPKKRTEALAEIDVGEGDARDRVVAVAEGDGIATVRASAAEALGDDGSFASVGALLGMLDDPDPQVLVATIEALDYAGDESLAPYVEPLADHPDPAVSEAAQDVLDRWNPTDLSDLLDIR